MLVWWLLDNLILMLVSLKNIFLFCLFEKTLKLFVLRWISWRIIVMTKTGCHAIISFIGLLRWLISQIIQLFQQPRTGIEELTKSVIIRIWLTRDSSSHDWSYIPHSLTSLQLLFRHTMHWLRWYSNLKEDLKNILISKIFHDSKIIFCPFQFQSVEFEQLLK